MPSGSGFPGFQAIGVDCFWNFPVVGSKVETMAAARTLPTRKGLAAAPVNAGLRKFLFFVEPRGSSKHVSAHLGGKRCTLLDCRPAKTPGRSSGWIVAVKERQVKVSPPRAGFDARRGGFVQNAGLDERILFRVPHKRAAVRLVPGRGLGPDR